MLAALGRQLNREAGRPAIPSLYFFTDPVRTPDPSAIAQLLPRGAAVVFRHFGKSNRRSLARELAAICGERGLSLLIAADPDLAELVEAEGVHWPERRMPRRYLGFALETAAAHSGLALRRAATAGMDAAILAPVLPSLSPSAKATMGLHRGSWLARRAGLPVIALGGVNTRTGARLLGRGFAGVAAVDAFLET